MAAARATAARTRDALAEAAREVRAAWSAKASALTGLVVAAGLVPLVAAGALPAERLVPTLYLALSAVGLAVTVGLAGMPSLAGGAFMAVGAFGTALLRARAGWPLIGAAVAGALAAGLGGVVVGLAVLRLRAVLLAVSTWLVSFLVTAALTSFPALSGGASGLVVPEGRLTLTPTAHYELALATLVVAMAAFAVVARSQIGTALAAMREHLGASLALGVPAGRLRLGCFVASAAVAGLAGGLVVDFDRVADAAAYEPELSFLLLVAVVLGGATVAAGPVVGVLALAALAQVATVGGAEGLQVNRIQTMLVAFTVVVLLGIGQRGLVPSLLAAWRAPAHSPATSQSGPVRCEAAPYPPAILEVRSVSKQFGKVPALQNVSLSVSGGTIHALIGPNGSGKTTVLRVLSGTVAAENGLVTLDGEPLQGSQRQRALRGVISTLQATAVFPSLTVLENALVGATLRRRYGGALRTLFSTPHNRAESRQARAGAVRALEIVGLSSVAHNPAASLPGWQQRLLMIAAALATSPRVLALDEPAAGATAAEVEQIGRVLGELRAAGMAILVVEHNLALMDLVADRVSVLEAGRVIATGSAREIRGSEAVRAAYLGWRGL
jgi:ABC-type branched-subunit amino acid transport system ATPase component/ABC-type branched-subunit amino acid transport system permease subunit